NNIKSAKKMIDKGKTEVWDALDEIIKDRPVMLNRAPTLHRLGIQAFEPVLVEGRALKLHPLCCTAFNADFDGDQMAIHVPLSPEAQAEARMLMLSANNLLRPQDGKPVTVPTQDMILGAYYLTYTRLGKAEKGAEEVFVTDAGETDLPVNQIVDADEFVAANKKAKAEGKKEAKFRPIHSYSSVEEAIAAYADGAIGLHAPIRVRYGKKIDGQLQYRMINATVGRLIYNEPIPQDLGFVDRSDPEHAFDLEVDFLVGKKQLGKIIDKCIRRHGFTISTEMLDKIKALGYKYSTKGAISVSIADMVVPAIKYELVKQAEGKVVEIENFYRQGFITDEERYRLVVQQWEKTTKDVTDALQGNLDEFNPIYMMADSGARGSMAQIRQLAGMRGLMADTAGRTIEIPVKANFREGLSVLEYFISSRGARKGMTDTALRTADSGYLTRRMVDVSQDVIIREHNCGTENGIWVGAVYDKNGDVVDSFGNRIRGRYPVNDVLHPVTGEVLHSKDVMMMPEDAAKFEAAGIEKIYIRTILACRARIGVCAKCYGMNLATSKEVDLGEAVGVIAAQSIGEPGTQLTMRTFHSGGVAGDDITQGLPRVEELFEARRPKKMATIAEITGVVHIDDTRRTALRNITVTAEDGEVKVYQVPYSVGLKVTHGKTVMKGEPITDGALYPQDVLRISGVEAVQDYLVQSVQAVYRQQGVEINDKHIEVIIRQMMRKVRVEDPGDTSLLVGTSIDLFEFEDANAAVQARIDAGEAELRKAEASTILLGITKAALATDSWLSAASFQETTKVLTDAAIKQKVDHLVGLKENVLIGKLIPAGSGLMAYRDYQPGATPESRLPEDFEAAQLN
ncbi:MAG: DNA-directed RNA polymerase subunit beta', partial [Ruminococcaceae bacterium]|nr:DNA-directed RNA polymerase subunit beta' [Oscillospiraceae bacterium]